MLQFPYNADVEKELLGILLNSPRTIPYCSKKITSSMFYINSNQALYRILLYLYNTIGEKIDPIIVVEQTSKTYPQYKDHIIMSLPDILHAGMSDTRLDWYIDKLVEYAARRKMMKMSEYMKNNANDLSISMVEITSKIQAGIDLIRNASKAEVDLRQDIEDMSLCIGSKNATIPFGIPVLDGKIAGFMRSDITTIGGRTGHGKTTFSIDTVKRITGELGYTADVITNEVTKMLYLQKLCCNIADVEYQKVIKYGEVTEEILEKINKAKAIMLEKYVGKLRVYEFVDNILEITSIINANKPDFFLLDWLQRIPLVPGVHDAKEWIKISYGEIARSVSKTNTAAVVVSQLSTRKAQMRSNKRPELYDFDDSSFIEKTSCDCHLLYWFYHDMRDRDVMSVAELINAKNRFGEPSTSLLSFNPASGRYSDSKLIPRERVVKYAEITGLRL